MTSFADFPLLRDLGASTVLGISSRTPCHTDQEGTNFKELSIADLVSHSRSRFPERAPAFLGFITSLLQAHYGAGSARVSNVPNAMMAGSQELGRGWD